MQTQALPPAQFANAGGIQSINVHSRERAPDSLSDNADQYVRIGETAVIRETLAEIRNTLRTEMRGYAAAMTAQQIDWLDAHAGGAARIYLKGNWLGVAVGKIEGDSWMPAEDGGNLIAIACTTAFECGHRIDDIVAFSPRRPESWALRAGVSWALGEDYFKDKISAQFWDGADATVRIVATPLEWLAAKGAAACVLNWRNREVFNELRQAMQIEAAPELADFLKSRLSRADVIPRITAISARESVVRNA